MRNKSLLKLFLILGIYLALVAISGVSLVMAIIKESVLWSKLWLIGSILLVIAAVFLDSYTNDYKLKYFFLGKKFRKQRDEYLKSCNNISKKEKIKLIKTMKSNYRRFGNVEYIVYEDYAVTPIKLYYEDYVAFNYDNSQDKQKIEYLIYCLYSKCLRGGGLYGFFEEIIEEPFSYEELKNLLNQTLISKTLKNLIISKKSKNVFEYFKNFENLKENELQYLKDYEIDYSNKLYDCQNEIFDMVEDIAVDKFFEYYKTKEMPKEAIKSYISKDNLRRVSICYLKNFGVYSVVRENFIFTNGENMAALHKEGCWIAEKESCYYETEELALKDLNKEIKDYKEIK